MALIVEDGTGKTDSESYLSVADADTYIAKFLDDPAAWTSLSPALKETALRKGTRYLNDVYGLRWLGSRTNVDQALHFPRSGIVDYDGFIIEDDEMPRELGDATAEAALRSVTETNGLLPDITETGSLKRKKLVAGPLESEKEYVGGTRLESKIYTTIERLLDRLVTGRNVVIVERA